MHTRRQYRSDPRSATTKRCPDCKKTKPVSEFHRNKSSSDGCAAYCKECWGRRNSAYYAKRAAERPEPPPEGSKQCSRCQQVKSFAEFHNYRGSTTGRTSWCKDCFKDYSQKRLSDPAEKAAQAARVRAGHYRRRYGISIEDYDRMFAEQGGVCALCSRPPEQLGKRTELRLAVDHCHETGAVRGLLCSPCNRLLHKLETDDDWIAKASAYLP